MGEWLIPLSDLTQGGTEPENSGLVFCFTKWDRLLGFLSSFDGDNVVLVIS